MHIWDQILGAMFPKLNDQVIEHDYRLFSGKISQIQAYEVSVQRKMSTIVANHKESVQAF